MPMKSFYKHLSLLAGIVSLLILGGCPSGVVQYTDLDEELGRASWNEIENLNARAKLNAGPYNSSLTMRINLPQESALLGAYIWSNGALSGHHPLRLDLQSSVGTTVAKIREDQEYFLLYDLRNNRAIVSSDPQEALRATINFPLPMSLGELALLLSGRYTDFFMDGGPEPSLLNTTVNRQSIFRLTQGRRYGYLTIDAQGYPQKWQSTEPESWIMELEYQNPVTLVANTSPLPGPRRITLEHPKGISITLQVKSLKKLPQPFMETQLNLLIPPSASTRELKSVLSQEQ
ncbi:MAG: hypothetical protein FWF99_03505 [Desulfovibrionaceae bacterium]|nr:hypothetical protein [Desulfovibrionaceae bacterium]